MFTWITATLAIIIMSITHWLYRWWKPKHTAGKLPPGTSGWPVLGETLQFLEKIKTSDIHPFVKRRMERYGPIFRTNLLGKQMIVSTDPEFNNFVFNQEGTLFESWVPTSCTKLFGEPNFSQIHGSLFKFLKKMVFKLFGLENLKKMVPEVENTVLQELQRWSNLDSVEVKSVASKIIFSLTAKKLISHEAGKSSDDLGDNFASFYKGIFSFPLNIPGTAYHKCLQGRERVMMVLRSKLKERRANPRELVQDFLDIVQDELSKEGTVLTEPIALNMILVLLFASSETTSVAITVAMKYLTDHPSVLQKLTEEHEEILRQRESNGDSELTWAEVKSMTYTFQVVNETLRLGNIAPLTFRKALKDVNIMGYTIPAGWILMVSTSAVHLNPTKYENPLEFNPSRWKGGSDNHSATKNFMAFGGGMKLCVGAEFSKLQMAVYLHHMVTKYRWEIIQGGHMIRVPGVQFPEGFHIRLYQRELYSKELKDSSNSRSSNNTC